MSDQEKHTQALLMQMIEGLAQLDAGDRLRLLTAVQAYFGLDQQYARTHSPGPSLAQREVGSDSRPSPHSFSDRALSPKEFLHDKAPKTDVERVACLAYFLTHYRDKPHFKTFDINKLNTEGAQLKLSNAAYSVANSVRRGLLAPAGKGLRQITAVGEKFVAALPDREAIKDIAGQLRSNRKRSGGKRKRPLPS